MKSTVYSLKLKEYCQLFEKVNSNKEIILIFAQDWSARKSLHSHFNTEKHVVIKSVKTSLFLVAARMFGYARISELFSGSMSVIVFELCGHSEEPRAVLGMTSTMQHNVKLSKIISAVKKQNFLISGFITNRRIYSRLDITKIDSGSFRTIIGKLYPFEFMSVLNSSNLINCISEKCRQSTN